MSEVRISEKESTDSAKLSPIQALRVARVILDGASPEWAANRYGVTVEQVDVASTFVAYRLSRHFRQLGYAPFSLNNAPPEHIDGILAVLVRWIDDLALPVLPLKADGGASTSPLRVRAITYATGRHQSLVERRP